MSMPAVARCDRGTALIEMAIVMGLLVTLLTGGFEVARYVLCWMKLDNVAGTIGDAVARAEEAHRSEVDAILAASDDIAAPFSFATRGYVIVSSVSMDAQKRVTVNWQRAGGGGLTMPSGIGATGGTATLPPGFTLQPNENAIVTEAFYSYQPVLVPALVPITGLRQVSVLRPRTAALITLQP